MQQISFFFAAAYKDYDRQPKQDEPADADENNTMQDGDQGLDQKSPTLWRVVEGELTVSDFDGQILHYFLQKYWRQYLGCNTSSLRGSTIKVGKELFDSSTGTFYGSQLFPRKAQKKPTAFVKISLPVDGNYHDVTAETDRVWRTYSGECLLFFTHSYQGDVLRTHCDVTNDSFASLFRSRENAGPFEPLQ